MTTGVSQRRPRPRHPLSGTVKWTSRGGSGHGELLEISRDGATFLVARRDAGRVRGHVTLSMELSPEMEWSIASGASVEHILPRDAATCRVSVAFPAS